MLYEIGLDRSVLPNQPPTIRISSIDPFYQFDPELLTTTLFNIAFDQKRKHSLQHNSGLTPLPPLIYN
jgi:hypothetical protein